MQTASPPDAAALAEGLQVVHTSHGRLRLHLPRWSGKGGRHIVAALRRLSGVTHVEANHVTGNVLILFAPRETTQNQVLDGVRSVRLDLRAAPEPGTFDARSAVFVEQVGRQRRVRIPVHGLDRDPALARRVEQQLEHLAGVQAQANPLTGRILVDYDERLIKVEDLIAEVAHLSLPCKPGEDEPTHPLDPRPLVQSATRAIGAAMGLGLVTAVRLVSPGAQGHGPAAAVAGVLNLLQAFPFVRNGLRRALGDVGADVAAHGVSIIALTVADIPLGLVLAGAEALLLLSVVTQRRAAWRRYEEGLDVSTSASAGSVIRLEPGMRVPRDARVLEGTGTALGRSGRFLALAPGLRAPAGARVAGGPFVLELLGDTPFVLQPRPVPPRLNWYRHYLRVAAPATFVYAAAVGLASGSLLRAFEALLLVNPRPALVGLESANLAASARVLRAGLTIVGYRSKRVIHLPDTLMLDGPRLLSDGKEVDRVLPLAEGIDADALLTLAGTVATAAGMPLGKALVVPESPGVSEGAFDGHRATARIHGLRYTLRAAREAERQRLPDAEARRGLVLALDRAGEPLGLIALRPRLLPGVARLVDTCQRKGVELVMSPGRDGIAARRIAERAGIALLADDDVETAIRSRQARGDRVAYVSDGAQAAAAFAWCDQAIGMAAGHSSYFPAQVDLLAPDLTALADFIETGRRRKSAVRDSVLLSAAGNVLGLAMSLSGEWGLHIAFMPGYATALAALGIGLFHLRGGSRPESALGYLTDPRPERWGRRSIPSVLRAFHTTEVGLKSAAAARRHLPRPASETREAFLAAVGQQLRSPLMSLLAGGACVTLLLGQPVNAALISTSLTINVLAGLWQERQVSLGGAMVRRLGSPTASVLRDGLPVTLPATELVPGDVILLKQGDRVPADARLLSADSLETGEAVLTGESLPVAKGPAEALPHHCIVLEGSDVIVGRGRAVVVAVGRHTRLGATAAAMSVTTQRDSPLGQRLTRVLRVVLPIALTGGAVTTVAGLAYGTAPVAEMVSLGIITALSTIPEGLPILAGVGQAAVAKRLAGRNTLVRRLAGIEALGRVDVACTDKTGTLTEGRLSACLVADLEREVSLPAETLDGSHMHVLRTAGLASPHPDDPHAHLHPTDVAVVRAAMEAGLEEALRAPRTAESPFDSLQGYHAACVNHCLCVKGAPERLAPWCVQAAGQPLDDAGRRHLLDRAHALAARGLRVLLVAEGPADVSPNAPAQLNALGFIGMSDPLRPSAAGAVARCQEAGIRVLMITGDHLGTACTIGTQIGIFTRDFDEAVNAADLHDLPADLLDRRLQRVAIVARSTPVDKVKVVESLRRQGHTVAMTGDGVNDAPAVRLADVGVAMGRGGTEAAQQAADVVLADDDFARLADALVEGRSFWRNMRHALGLLLGGNAGELAVIVGVTATGAGAPLTAAQIWLVSLITDALPSLALALQGPRERNLAHLAREGLAGMDASLPRDTLRRGLATGVSSLGAHVAARVLLGPAEAGAVTFTSIIATQLAQTLDMGQSQGMLSRPIVGAVAGSAAALGLILGVPTVRGFFGLALPSLAGWGMIAGSAAAAVALSRGIGVAGHVDLRGWLERWSLGLPRRALALPAPLA